MKFFLKLFFLTWILILNGCTFIYGERGIFHNRNTDYLQARSIPPLMIPPCYSSSTIQAHYPVSDQYYGPAKKVDLTPPELYNRISSAPIFYPQPVKTISQPISCAEVQSRRFTPNTYYDAHTRSASVRSIGSSLAPLRHMTFATQNIPPRNQRVLKQPTTGVAKNIQPPQNQFANTNRETQQIKRHYFDAYASR